MSLTSHLPLCASLHLSLLYFGGLIFLPLWLTLCKFYFLFICLFLNLKLSLCVPTVYQVNINHFFFVVVVF